MSCTVSKRSYDMALMDAPAGGAAADAAAWLAPHASPLENAPSFHGGASASGNAPNMMDAGYTPPKRCRTAAPTAWSPSAATWSPFAAAQPAPAPAPAEPQLSPMRPFVAAGTPTAMARAGAGATPSGRSSNAAAAAALATPFQSTSSSAAAIMEDFDRFLARRKRPALGSSNTANAAGAAANGPVLFTYAEVRDITSRALVEQEERLRLEFQAVLRDRLSEQYENFSRFNQDYVARQLRESHFDYMS